MIRFGCMSRCALCGKLIGTQAFAFSYNDARKRVYCSPYCRRHAKAPAVLKIMKKKGSR